MKTSDIANKRMAVHTPTLKEFKDVVRTMLEDGYCWLGGEKELQSYHWNDFEENTCIDIGAPFGTHEKDRLTFSYKERFKENGCKIITTKKFLSGKIMKSIKFILVYEIDEDPIEYFETLPQVKKRIRELQKEEAHDFRVFGVIKAYEVSVEE